MFDCKSFEEIICKFSMGCQSWSKLPICTLSEIIYLALALRRSKGVKRVQVWWSGVKEIQVGSSQTSIWERLDLVVLGCFDFRFVRFDVVGCSLLCLFVDWCGWVIFGSIQWGLLRMDKFVWGKLLLWEFILDYAMLGEMLGNVGWFGWGWLRWATWSVFGYFMRGGVMVS